MVLGDSIYCRRRMVLGDGIWASNGFRRRYFRRRMVLGDGMAPDGFRRRYLGSEWFSVTVFRLRMVFGDGIYATVFQALLILIRYFRRVAF